VGKYRENVCTGTENLQSVFTPTRLWEMMATNALYSKRGELQEFTEVGVGRTFGKLSYSNSPSLLFSVFVCSLLTIL